MAETAVAPVVTASPTPTQATGGSPTPPASSSTPTAPVAKGGEPTKAPAPSPEAPKPDKWGFGSPTQTAEHTIHIKVNGEERFLTPKEAGNLAQHGLGARQKFTEAQKMAMQAQSLIRMLKENPIAVLQHPSIGHDFKKLAEVELMKQINLEKMTPEQRELAEAREKLRAAEEEKKGIIEKQEQERHAALTQHFQAEYSKDIVQTLETASLPKTQSTVRRMAYYMNEGLKRGVPLKASDVIDLVKEDYINEIKSLFGSTDGDKLLSIVGDDVARKIREADLARVNGGDVKTPKPGELPPAPIQEEKPKPKTLEEWRAEMDKKYGPVRAT